ncbi:hypothetical protein BYT27DRAFT_7095966 [Phlegmacium glaucopus]|nr:hypothetical protein BYT27DRAFT_7095966 [Phlegmacium glaucopus]
MPEKLTVAEQAIVAKASQDLYQYERICEEHSAILLRDLEGCTKEHQEYTENSNLTGFMPPCNKFDHYIEESEKVLKKECRTVLDHLHVVHAAYFLCWLLMTKVSEHGEHIYLEFISCMPIKAFLSKQYPYIFPESSSAAIHISSEPAPSDYPTTLVVCTFELKEVMNLPRVLLQETELIQYQCNPELLQRETFVSFNEDEADYKVFHILAFITADQERAFYVVYADEGPEAVACTSINLFDLLCTSE